MFPKVFILLILKFCSLNADEALKICLKDLGCLEGTYMPGYPDQGEKFEAYMGVPYAKPPIGELRFKNPERVPAWSGVLSATKPQADCMQKNYIIPTWPISGSEDCLYLNLYRPAQRSTAILPVMFFIHGGGLFSGSANPGVYGPEYLMDTQEVIVVVVQYRLGPFGFLSTGDENIPGNFGLKDQNLALKWVHDNIAAFGGDPEAVTIVGHSAGASSTHFHMLSSASRGFFKHAVIISGTAISPFVDILEQPKEQALKVAQNVGIQNAAVMSSADLADSLRSADATSLLNAGDSLRFWHMIPLTTYRPTIEGVTWSNAFLTEHPATILANGNFTHTPWMIGVMEKRGEGSIPTLNIMENDELGVDFNENFDYYFTKMLQLPLNKPEGDVKMILNMIVDEYLQGRHVLNNMTFEGFREFLGDSVFYYPLYKSLRYYIQSDDLQRNPVHIFQFKYRGPYSFSTFFTGGSLKNYGAVHHDDIIYLFRSPLVFPQDFAKDSEDAKLVKTYVNFLVEFAKNGIVPELDTPRRCTEASFTAPGDFGICDYLSIDNDGATFKKTVQNDYDVKRMHFWDKIFGYSG